MRNFRKISNIIFVLSIFVIKISADLPVHCLQHQILGKWKVYLSDPVKNTNVVNCGHDIPDNPLTSNFAMQKTFKSVKEFTIEILEDNNVINLENNNLGRWTMVYDEG